MNLAPESAMEFPEGQSAARSFAKSATFTAAFTSATFVGAVIWQYESLRKRAQNSLGGWVAEQWNQLGGWEHKEWEFRKEVNRWWNSLSDGHKVFWPLCFLNVVVFAAWHHPALQRTMLRYFCANPAARAVCWPMVLSTFSHFAALHLAMNMYVLHSFTAATCATLGREQFLALYLSGGVVSSLASHAFKLASRCPGPSLGASGAIMALLGYFCTSNPGAQLGIVFVPGLSFSADHALKAVMCVDAVGVAMGWRTFDHAAHLGGALFGLAYAKWGDGLWGRREPVMRAWHDLRTAVTEGATKDK